MIQGIASSVLSPSIFMGPPCMGGQWVSRKSWRGVSLQKTNGSFGSPGWLDSWIPNLYWWWWKACSHAYSDCSSEKQSSQSSAWLWASVRQPCGAPMSPSSCTPMKLPSYLPSQKVESLREAWVSPLHL
ncbi:hypothetical protein P7K49_014259 [Saguinus oedipus]|uniref:Uncharacterized protein n=1 Tax=Saguinus oedipus TaxID=9490 RepID=A0ABQ9VI90_SAGOE|nr:hypothetical protein P7K49_014259 [Saguinus oedipus]